MKLSIGFFCIIVVALICLRFHLNSSKSETPTILEIHKESGIPVSVGYPRRKNLSKIIEVTGTMVEKNHIHASFNTEGRLKTLNWKVGDYIEKGQVIATLVSVGQKILVEGTKAQLQIATANLDKALKGPRQLELESGKAALESARAAYSFAKEELSRVKGLVKQQAATQRQLDNATSVFQRTLALKRQAQNNLDLLKEGTRKEDIIVAKGQKLLAKAKHKTVMLNLKKRTLKAPVTGVISAVPVDVGDVIKTMPSPKTIIEILEIDTILMECQISELHIPSLKKETIASITVDAFPGILFKGTLYELVPKGNNSNRTFTVKFAINNTDHRLKPGMFARANITLKTVSNALIIPVKLLRKYSTIEYVNPSIQDISASQEPSHSQDVSSPVNNSAMQNSSMVVLVSENGISAAKTVTAGITVNSMIEIISGLNEKDLIITEGFAELKAGEKLLTSRSYSKAGMK